MDGRTVMVFGFSRQERELRRLQKQREKNIAEWDRVSAAAKKEGVNREELAERTRDFCLIDERLSDLIANADHKLLVRKADSLLIPLPEFKPGSEDVEEGLTTGWMQYKPHARQRLREDIQKAEDRISERRRWWGTTFISAVSMAIAFLALWFTLCN